MTTRLPFTENAIARAMAGARKGGMKSPAVTIAPDGTLTVYESLDPHSVTVQTSPASNKWAESFGT